MRLQFPLTCERSCIRLARVLPWKVRLPMFPFTCIQPDTSGTFQPSWKSSTYWVSAFSVGGRRPTTGYDLLFSLVTVIPRHIFVGLPFTRDDTLLHT